MGALVGYADEGVLTINSVSMNCPAWACTADENGNNGLLQLWMSAEKRGENRELPATHGVIGYTKYRTGTRFDLNITITGDVNRLGAPNANCQTGMATNMKYLRDNVIDPGDAQPDGAVTAGLVMWGETLSAEIQVLRLTPTGPYPVRQHEALFNGVLQIEVLGGRFA